jgi:hypothetical protein
VGAWDNTADEKRAWMWQGAARSLSTNAPPTTLPAPLRARPSPLDNYTVRDGSRTQVLMRTHHWEPRPSPRRLEEWEGLEVASAWNGARDPTPAGQRTAKLEYVTHLVHARGCAQSAAEKCS